MEKLAVLELNTTNVKLILANVVRNKSFVVYNEVVVPINLVKDFEEDEIIKPVVAKELVSALLVFKKMLEKEGVDQVIAIACNFVRRAKNQSGFLNEIYSISGFNFKILSAEEEIAYIYTSCINTFNKPKALVVNVGEYNTQILLYNRRNILNVEILPFGSVNLQHEIKGDLPHAEQVNEMMRLASEKLSAYDFMRDLEDEYEVIGVGAAFLNLSNLTRRAVKYPLENDHNYAVTKENFNKVFDAIKPFDQTKSSKVKGVSVEDTKNLKAGLAIIGAVFEAINKQEISVSKFGASTGLLINTVVPYTLEKPISDNLGYSLQVINDYYDPKPNNSEHIYNLSMILFKQLKVLHKLNRSFVKVLRVASYLSASGRRVDFGNAEKASFNIILHSNIYGISHSELVLSAFVALLRDQDNFNLPEWVKYKDLVSETDLDAVKKLAVILKIAESLDITTFGNIIDISCDILGDSVIMKTITSDDASLEIKQAMQNSAEFRKAFNKKLEIL